ncbi:MAG TPA: hypothetical protein VJ742_01080, partial [Nitrososphaera sp.]|nr:hypothetical protein [Nitrososphaera sp.]
MEKLFTFSADSFSLDLDIESFLRTKNAIYMDFGLRAYIKSESMPSILSELESAAKVYSKQSDATELLKAELEKSLQEKAGLITRTGLMEAELASLRTQVASALQQVQKLDAEKRLSSQRNTPNSIQQSGSGSDALRQSYEKLRTEFQTLMSQSIESIASLKVLEE